MVSVCQQEPDAVAGLCGIEFLLEFRKDPDGVVLLIKHCTPNGPAIVRNVPCEQETSGSIKDGDFVCFFNDTN